MSKIPPMISQSQISCNTPKFYSAIQPAIGCYNSWANLRCSGCYPLGEKLLWNRSIISISLDKRAEISLPQLLNMWHRYCITVTSYWARWRLKSPASPLLTQPFMQAQIKEKNQSSVSLAFVRVIHRWPVNSPHKGPVIMDN